MSNAETVRKLPAPALATVTLTADDELSPKAEMFARHFAESGNATASYRACYDVSADTDPATVTRKAHALRHTPAVAARIRAIHAAAIEGTVVSVRSRAVKLQQLCDADPGELIRVVHTACRWCWGKDGNYMYRDAVEHARALDDYARSVTTGKPLPMPHSAAGGYGYRGNREPNPECGACDGEGVTRTVITPTDDLSPGARALLKGIRQKGDSIEVILHSQLEAADMLNRMENAYTERHVHISARVDVPMKDMAPEDAYEFIKSLVPA